MEATQLCLNPARDHVVHTLQATIDALRGDRSVSEIDFARIWHERLRRITTLCSDGWYTPPPHGMVVITADVSDVSRLAYTSLREERYWPSERTIDWDADIMMAYASPIDRNTGLAGDFAVTLYFGDDPKLRTYFRDAHRVVRTLLDAIEINDTTGTLFNRAEELFAAQKFTLHTTSVTDQSRMNIGHTMPRLPPDVVGGMLTLDQITTCRSQRRFLSTFDDWPIARADQFTIEPQLRSLQHSELPCLTFHFLVCVEPSGIMVANDVDTLLAQYRLASDHL